MSTEKMTLERLRAVIEAYGTSAPRWPETERAAAAALLAESAEARALLAAATPLDELLDAVPAITPTAAMRAAILAAAPRGRLRRGEAWRGLIGELGGWRLAGAVLAASLVLGIVSGGWLSLGQTTTETSSPDLLQLAQLDDSAAEY